jgi:hypothetical protein
MPKRFLRQSGKSITFLTPPIFFFGWCYSYGPQQGPDRQQKKEERGLKQRRKQKEAAQGDPEPKKGNLPLCTQH